MTFCKSVVFCCSSYKASSILFGCALKSEALGLASVSNLAYDFLTELALLHSLQIFLVLKMLHLGLKAYLSISTIVYIALK